jgi:hypothetical protein
MAEWLSSSTSDNMPTTNVLCKPDNFAKCTLYSHLPMTSRLVWIQPRINLSNQNQSIVHKSMIGPYFPPVEGLMSYLRCLTVFPPVEGLMSYLRCLAVFSPTPSRRSHVLFTLFGHIFPQ